jgi:very-short-patch-repair endonuclease
MQQAIFHELRRRGFAVEPQYRVDAKVFDFVVTGAHGRLAVECDGPSVPLSPDQIGEEIARERELRRSGWRVVRIRESDYLLDPEAALRPLWAELSGPDDVSVLDRDGYFGEALGGRAAHP